MKALPLAADVVYRSGVTHAGWYWPALVIVVLVIIGIALFLKWNPTTDVTLRKCLVWIAVALTVAVVVLIILFILERAFGVYF